MYGKLEIVKCTTGDRNLQQYFAPPETVSMHAEIRDNYKGCCTTVSLLVMLVSMRFGFRTPQLVVDLLRDVIIVVHAHTTMRPMNAKQLQSDSAFMEFIKHLRAWQTQLSHRSIPWWVRDISWLKKWLAVAPSSTCSCMIYEWNGELEWTGRICGTEYRFSLCSGNGRAPSHLRIPGVRITSHRIFD